MQWMNPYTLVNETEFENSWTLAIQLEVCTTKHLNFSFELSLKSLKHSRFGREFWPTFDIL
jgi:hypothetical protein